MAATSKDEVVVAGSNSGSAPDGWPAPLGPAALIGPVGDLISIIGPQTESDPAALVAEVLCAFGVAVGPKPHFLVEQTVHRLNLFMLLAGKTAQARKGTSWAHVEKVLREVDPELAKTQLQSGLSTSEGLIDAISASNDKRFIFVEDEFAAVLRAMSRPGNILSNTLRRTWDGKTLQVARRTNPVRAEQGHVGLIGHTTIADLERFLSTTEIVNGFANRALWVCTRRSKLLPFGGQVPEEDLLRLVKRIKKALRFATGVEEIGLTAKAAKLWTEKYVDLSADRPGLVGAATSRAEAQTRRIAAIYALLDESDQVYVPHLRAALELWRYCAESAQFIFGRRRSTIIEDEILQMLREAKTKGISRNEISAAFSRHRRSYEIGFALERLRDSGRATLKKVSTGGRSAERWFLI